MKEHLDGVIDWLKHEYFVETAYLPLSVALALEHLKRAEREASGSGLQDLVLDGTGEPAERLRLSGR